MQQATLNNEQLAALRQKWGLTQAELAHRLGMGRRWYIHLEVGDRPIKRYHQIMLERISIDIAVERSDPSLIVPSLRYILDHLITLYIENEAQGPR